MLAWLPAKCYPYTVATVAFSEDRRDIRVVAVEMGQAILVEENELKSTLRRIIFSKRTDIKYNYSLGSCFMLQLFQQFT